MCHECARHSHFRGFSKAAFGLRHGPDLAAESNFAKEDCVDADRLVVHARCKGSSNSEVAGRLLQTNAADDVEKHVELRKRKAGALVEDREQQSETTIVETCRDALR